MRGLRSSVGAANDREPRHGRSSSRTRADAESPAACERLPPPSAWRPARDPRRAQELRCVALQRGSKIEFRMGRYSCDFFRGCAAIPDMIGKSEAMQRLIERVRAAARVLGSILVTGETGS